MDARDGLFGFRELAAARQMAKLLADGVPLSSVIKSLGQIRRWLPNAGLSNVRLTVEGESLLLDQGQVRTDTKGQYVFSIASPSPDADALFQQAQSAEERGDLAEAEQQYRAVVKVQPQEAVTLYNLGNVLRATGR